MKKYTTHYSLKSAQLFNTPSVFAWAQDHFQTDRTAVVRVFSDGFNLGDKIALGILSGRIPVEIDHAAGTVSFETNIPKGAKASHRNARFWTYCHYGPVKLTLKPGQRMEHSTGGPTEEGWHREDTSWEYPSDEEAIYREWCSDGRDCDGRLTRGGVDRCPTDQLREGPGIYPGDDAPATWEGVVWPDWQEHENHGVFDEFAQQMGY